MFRIFNTVLVLAVLGAAFALYSLEHANRQGERRIARAEREIAKTHERIKFINAEWANLSRPDRIQALTAKFLNLRPMRPDQVATLADIAKLEAPVAAPASNTQKDPIADILEEMQ